MEDGGSQGLGDGASSGPSGGAALLPIPLAHAEFRGVGLSLAFHPRESARNLRVRTSPTRRASEDAGRTGPRWRVGLVSPGPPFDHHLGTTARVVPFGMKQFTRDGQSSPPRPDDPPPESASETSCP